MMNISVSPEIGLCLDQVSCCRPKRLSANFFSVSLSSYCSRYWYTKYTKCKAEMDGAVQRMRRSKCNATNS
jgi:hypothetical protein